MDDASNMAKNAMPNSFTVKMEWIEWTSTLVKFLKSQPGRILVPLNYVVRYNEATTTIPNSSFLDNYVNRTFSTVRYFLSNASKVQSYIFRLISKNFVSEHKIFIYKDSYYSHFNFMALKEYYKCVSANAKSTLKTERDLQDLY